MVAFSLALGNGQVSSIKAMVHFNLSIKTKSGLDPFPEEIKISAGIVVPLIWRPSRSAYTSVSFVAKDFTMEVIC